MPGRVYHRIILAEFLGCLLLIGTTPILIPKTTSGKGGEATVDTGQSLAGPLVRLTALCIVFFVLALMGTGRKTGKVAAAFGGLVLLGTALNSTATLTALGKAIVAGTGGSDITSEFKPGAPTAPTPPAPPAPPPQPARPHEGDLTGSDLPDEGSLT
jgi:hypothetical protein